MGIDLYFWTQFAGCAFLLFIVLFAIACIRNVRGAWYNALTFCAVFSLVLFAIAVAVLIISTWIDLFIKIMVIVS